jgi:ribose transport system permease protein
MRSRLASIARDYALVGFIAVMVLIFWLLSPEFMTAQNWSNVLSSQVVDACVALAVILPLIAGEYDLSVGYLIGFIIMLGAYLGGHHSSLVIILIAMLACGIVVGLINGILTVTLKINSFISTLGVGILLSGLTLGLSGGSVLYQGIPAGLTNFGGDRWLGLNPGVFVVLALGAILLYALEHTPTGNRLYATGASPRVARLAGIRISLLKIGAFTCGALLIGLGAILELAQAGTASPSYGPELLLPGYAAAFLGATAHRPGRFNVIGTLIAVVLLAVGFNGLSLLGVAAWFEPVFNGIVLLIAVLVSRSQGRSVQLA